MPHGLTLLARGLNHIEGVLARISPDVNMVAIARESMREDFLRNIDWKEEVRSGSLSLYRSLRNLVDLPTMIAKILREYSTGQTRINLDLHASEQLARLLDHIVRHINLGLWVTALLISSSILCTTNMEPKVLGIPLLGAVGYVLAVIIMLYMVVKYLVSKK
jgi:ubiquinone biosynthesis protein